MRPTANRLARHRPSARQRGAAAVLAMMFLVIFGSLATAMAIVAHGNLRTADSHLKLNRALSAADSGMQFLLFQINNAIRQNQDFVIEQGVIDEALALELWEQLRDDLQDALAGASHNVGGADPWTEGLNHRALHIGPIAVGAYSDTGGATSIPVFKAVIMPHPITASYLPEMDNAGHPFHGHSYDSSFYGRLPYAAASASDVNGQKLKHASGITWPVSSAAPLDARWIRIKVIGIDGPRDENHNPLPGAVVRSVSMDFRIDKRIRAAVLSRNRVMVGRNVLIEGRLGSLFDEVDLEHGHPIQMESDFLELVDPADRDGFLGDLEAWDVDGDNRLKISTEVPSEFREAARANDLNNDGFIDDYDLFLGKFGRDDGSGRLQVTQMDLESGGMSAMDAEQLVRLIDTFGNPDRPGYGDGVITDEDRYAKIRGEVIIRANKDDWEAGAARNASSPADSTYRDYFGGPIHPNHGEAPLTFDASLDQFPQFDQHSFEAAVRNLRDEVSTDLYTQAQNAEPHNGTPEMDLSGNHVEQVPFGAAHPYDYYNRQVFRNMTFKNVKIPRGANALFINCRFIGVTFVDTTPANHMPHPSVENANAFNYSGMQESDGSYKHPDIDQQLRDQLEAIKPGATTTKDLGNNLRFHNCRFEGAVVSGDAESGSFGAQPDQYSHTRNKLTFTGETTFADVTKPTEAPDLTSQQRELLQRGTVLAPHFSVEIGSFTNPYSSSETVNMTGTIVAGVIDLRGQVSINGTILTTFEARSDEPGSPILGDTSPNFNTTLGYFSSEAGDLESETPDAGLGVIHVRYNPDLALPDGVRARISLRPLRMTYFEGGYSEPRVD